MKSIKGFISLAIILLMLVGCSDSDSGSSTNSGNSQAQELVSNAGLDQGVEVNSEVILSGEMSTNASGQPLSYKWVLTKPEGSNSQLDSNISVSPKFIADKEGLYTAQLIVSDGEKSSAPATTKITVYDSLFIPIANAGLDKNQLINEQVVLDGSNSILNNANGKLSYDWKITTKPFGSSVVLSFSDNVKPSLIPDMSGAYVVQLIVDNGIAKSQPAKVTITVFDTELPKAPTANAGANQNVKTGQSVKLNGVASSSSKGEPLSYSWSLISKPIGSMAWLNNDTTVTLSFTPDLDGTYIAQLIVNDGLSNSSPSTVSITATSTNATPVALAGDDESVPINSKVTLDGSRSFDSDGDTLRYTWAMVSKPSTSQAFLLGNETVSPSFTADKAGNYVVSLVVNDGLEDSKTSSVVIEAKAPHVQLSKKDSSFFGNSFDEQSFPYTSSGVSNVSVSGIPTPTTYSHGTYKLKAVGQNFTIINLQADSSLTSQIQPKFTRLTEGYTLTNGSEVEFELISALTRGQVDNLTFSFEIKETGEKFELKSRFQSN